MNLMSALAFDLATGVLSPAVGNAIVNSQGKTLKVVEMQHKYGTVEGNERRLALISGK